MCSTKISELARQVWCMTSSKQDQCNQKRPYTRYTGPFKPAETLELKLTGFKALPFSIRITGETRSLTRYHLSHDLSRNNDSHYECDHSSFVTFVHTYSSILKSQSNTTIQSLLALTMNEPRKTLHLLDLNNGHQTISPLFL